jgi:uncharacterized cupredoxin-like copper-binding protein
MKKTSRKGEAMKKTTITIAVLAVFAVIVAACGASAGTADNPRKVEIDAKDFAFDPTAIDITEGETVEFVITNTGAIAHEFRVMNQDEIDEHLEAGHEEGHDEAGEEMSGDEMAMEDVIIEIEPEIRRPSPSPLMMPTTRHGSHVSSRGITSPACMAISTSADRNGRFGERR